MKFDFLEGHIKHKSYCIVEILLQKSNDCNQQYHALASCPTTIEGNPTFTLETPLDVVSHSENCYIMEGD